MAGKQTITAKEAVEWIKKLGDEFIVIHNPNYVYADFDICPLAPKIQTKRDRILAIVQDMDGTTTTTENLCLHSLEIMIRQFTGRLTQESWKGLDHERDYPNIIGNSTTKHVEYLIKSYQSNRNDEQFRRAYLKSAIISYQTGRDENRKREVLNNLIHFKCRHLAETRIDPAGEEKLEELVHREAENLIIRTFPDQVRAAIDIYYQRYHEILARIDSNDIAGLRRLLPDENHKLIEPMPGVGIFLATVKGWLGEDLALFHDQLKEMLMKIPGMDAHLFLSQRALKKLGVFFQKHPLKIAIVTSSIAYEANIVLNEVFKIVRRQIEDWPLTADKKRGFIDRFSSCQRVFDSVITASDSSEIRLKPHRDLYSMALHQLGISKKDFDKVIGFEDSESGTIAIRAAGIGLCIAVPFADTRGHRLDYASHVLHGGLPEVLLVHGCFLETGMDF